MPQSNLFNHGNGKGDQPRHEVNATWRKRFSRIKWGALNEKNKGFVRKGPGKISKKYS